MLARSMVTAAAAMEVVKAFPRHGVDTARVLGTSALSGGFLRDENRMIPLAAFTALLETAAFDATDPVLGLQLGRDFSVPSLGPICVLTQSADTLGSACLGFTEYFSLIQTNTRVTLTSSGGMTRWTYGIIDPAVRCRTQDAAFTIAMQHKMLESLTGPHWAPSSIELPSRPDGDLADYARFFPCPVHFGGGESAIVFPTALLDLTLRSRDPHVQRRVKDELAAASRQQNATLSFIDSVEDWLASSYAEASPVKIEEASASFGMSLRSFQRVIGDSGMTFRDVRNKVRARLARSMLTETSMTITTIALQLGYSESSAFSRGFKMQVGVAPLQYRSSPDREQLLH